MSGDPNWAEQVTAIATAIGAIGLLSAIGATIFAARQVSESQHSRHAQAAVDFLRRWDEHDLVETRRLVAQYKSGEELASAFVRDIASNSMDAFVLYRELDYFEQVAALEHLGALDLTLVRVLLGHRLVERYDLWKPSLDAMGANAYPMFTALAERMRQEGVSDAAPRVPAASGTRSR